MKTVLVVIYCFILQLYRDWLPFVYSKDALSNGVLPTVAQKAAIFLLLFGLILKLLKQDGIRTAFTQVVYLFKGNLEGTLSKSLRRPLLRRSWMRCPGQIRHPSLPNFNCKQAASKQLPNGVSREFAFAVSKTQGRRNNWKTRSVKYFLDEVRNNLRQVLKKRRKGDFYTHVVATTPEYRSLRCRIWRYGLVTSFSSRLRSEGRKPA